MADLLARIPFIASAYQKFIDMGAGDGGYAAYNVNIQLISRISATFARPGDTNAYSIGDLVANSTVAGSVVPMSFAVARTTAAGGRIRRATLRKSGVSIANASFRLHLYSLSPTPTNGDNGAWSTNKVANYVGAFDITCDKAFTDGASGIAVPIVGQEISFVADTHFGLLEARAAYTPANAEQFTTELEVWPN